jgi:homoserine O-acetyltransferase
VCFAVADEEQAAALLPHAALKVIPGVWGHLAGAGSHPRDREFIGDALRQLLALHTTNAAVPAT